MNAEPFAQVFAEAFIVIAFVVAEFEIAMGGGEREFEEGLNGYKQFEQGDGIRAARQRNQHSIATFKQATCGAVFQKFLFKRTQFGFH